MSPAEAIPAPGFDQRLDAFITEVVAPNAAAAGRGEGLRPRDLIRAAGAHGVAGLLVPERHGGMGMGFAAFATCIERVATVCASASVALDVHLSVATEPIVRFGSEDQQRRWLPRLATGQWLGAFALTEPNAGSDAASLSTRALRQDGGWQITGTKIFITNGSQADLVVVMARTGGAGAAGITAFVVETAKGGVATGGPMRKLGLHGSETVELVLDRVEVTDDTVLGGVGGGFAVAMASLDSGRVGISAQATGIAQGAVDAMIAHHRRCDDAAASLLDTGVLAECAARTTAARALTAEAARRLDCGRPVALAASIAKLYSSDAAVFAAHAAIEFCAPASVHRDHPASVRLCDAKACQIYEGTNQVQRMVIARRLLEAARASA